MYGYTPKRKHAGTLQAAMQRSSPNLDRETQNGEFLSLASVARGLPAARRPTNTVAHRLGHTVTPCTPACTPAGRHATHTTNTTTGTH